MFVFILVIHLLFCASNDAVTSIDLSQITQTPTEQLSQLPAVFFLTKLEIIPDIRIEEEELRSLCDLPERVLVSREAVAQSLVRLARKKKFKTVHIDPIFHPDGVHLRISLISEWTLNRLHVQGSLLGKDKYSRFYMIEPGEIFDHARHETSKLAIMQALAAAGYWNAVITDSLFYDDNNKSVIVTVSIEPKKQCVIRDICVHVEVADGVSAQEKKELEKKIVKLLDNLLKSSGYSKELLDSSAKKLHEYLMGQGFFNSIIELEEACNDTKSALQLYFTITLKQKSLFMFQGNTFFTEQFLLDQIRLFGKSATLIPPSLIAEEIIALYKKEGFWNIGVTWEDEGERTSFFIKEGERIAISKISIQGASEISETELIKKYGKKLLSARYYHDDLLKSMLEEIGQAYIQQGFWDFSIITYEHVPISDTHYHIVLHIHEGKRRYLTGVSIEKDFCGDQNTGIVPYGDLKKPIPFDMSIIKEQKHRLTKLLQAQGRLYARPYPELIEEADGTRLVWKYAGSTDLVTFGDTIILGNSSLPSHIITRELLYKKGDVWDQRKIEKSVTRLKQLGIFDSVTLAPEDLETTELSKTLLLKYAEDYPYEVRARLGIQGVNKNIVQFNKGLSYKAGGSFLVKNPFNRGDCFRFDLDFSRYMYNVVASYKIPWFLYQPIRTEFKAYTTHYDQPFVIGSPLVLYQAIQDGFLFGFSKNYASCDVDLNIGCEWLEIKPGDGCGGPDRLAQALFLNQRLINKKYPYVFVQPSFFYSSLDNKIQPTKGALSLITCKAMIAPTFSRAAFFKILLEQSFFVPWGSFVFAWRGRCGTIFNTDFQNINPIERFYLGGAYSIRSYEPDLAPPLNPFRDVCGCLHLVPTGGRSMANMNTEVRFPLFGSLSGVLFNDLGVLSDKAVRAAVKEHKLVGALGFGLRFNTVVGPIRFDIGWKLHRSQFPSGVRPERPYAWFLALGNAF